jgi:phenylacetate-CoA ligase
MITDRLKKVRNFINYHHDDTGNPLGKIISDVRIIRKFSKTLGFLMESQWRSGEWHNEYQGNKLRELIDFAVRYVPFYRDSAKNIKIDKENIDPRQLLREFPIINESRLRSDFDRFIPDNWETRDNVALKFGDDPQDVLRIPVDSSTLMLDKAMIARHYENSGYRIGSPVLCFVNEIEESEGERYHLDKANNRHYLAINHLDRKNLSDYCGRVKESKADFVFGYPGSLEVFVDYILEWEIELKFNGVITSGEVLTDTVRNKIESAFDTKVYDLYRHSLPVTGMGQCQYCDGYHLFSEYSVLELVDFDGNIVEEEGKAGKIVATSTSNRAFPLIRLDTGDVGIYDGKKCDCGRGNTKVISKISGAAKELLINAEGEMEKTRSAVREYQF